MMEIELNILNNKTYTRNFDSEIKNIFSDYKYINLNSCIYM